MVIELSKKFVFVEEELDSYESAVYCNKINGTLASEKDIDYIFFNEVKKVISHLYNVPLYTKGTHIRVAHKSGLIGESVKLCYKEITGMENRYRRPTSLYVYVNKFCSHDYNFRKNPFLCMLHTDKKAPKLIANENCFILETTIYIILALFITFIILYSLRKKIPYGNKMKTLFRQCFFTCSSKLEKKRTKNFLTRKKLKEIPVAKTIIKTYSLRKSKNDSKNCDYLTPNLIAGSSSTDRSLGLSSNTSSFSDDSVFYTSIKSINTVGREHVYEDPEKGNRNDSEYIKNDNIGNSKAGKNNRYDCLKRF